MDRLLELLRTHSFAKRRVVLASGRESDFFIDCKQTVLRAEGHALVGEAVLARLDALPERPVAVAGVALGGCSLASAVALLSQQGHRAGGPAPLDAVYVRNAKKDHGSRRSLEGNDHLAPGAPVAVLEDVVTTGGSTLDAVARLRAHDLRVVGVVAIVERGEGGAERIRQASIPLEALYGRGDFLDD